MDIITVTDYKIEDDFITQHEANKSNALRAFYEEISVIQMKFEHLIIESRDVDGIYQVVVDINDAQVVAKGLNDMDELSYFNYVDLYDDTEYEYNFSDEVNRIKRDELGMEC